MIRLFLVLIAFDKNCSVCSGMIRIKFSKIVRTKQIKKPNVDFGIEYLSKFNVEV